MRYVLLGTAMLLVVFLADRVNTWGVKRKIRADRASFGLPPEHIKSVGFMGLFRNLTGLSADKDEHGLSADQHDPVQQLNARAHNRLGH